MNFDINTYKDLLAERESGNNYTTNTGNGAYGKYQFLKSTIKGIANILNEEVPSIDEFLHSPQLQERYLDALVRDSLNYISNNNLESFENVSITGQGNNITALANIYGLVAGIHLGGARNLKDFLRNKEDKKDSNGTYISDYVALFSDKFDVKKKSNLDNSSNNIPDAIKKKLTLIIFESIESINKTNEILKKLTLLINDNGNGNNKD